MLKLKSFYYIRHGETAWNLEGRCMGQQNIPLNSTGIQQANSAKVLLSNAKNVKIETICYSPLIRAKHTAEIINKTLRCPSISIENLKECRLGALEGQLKKGSTFYNSWINGETPVGAETFTDFLKRALEGINEALSYPNPLIVAHGGVYWAILQALDKEYTGRSVIPSSIPNATPLYYRAPLLVNESWCVTTLEEKYNLEQYEYI